MKAKKFFAVILSALALTVAAGVLLPGLLLPGATVEALQGGMVEAPLFEVDPFWPKPLPNHWILGNSIGVGVDSRDHVFIVHRRQSLNPGNEGNVGSAQPAAECCEAAPNVLEFDPAGNLVGSFGGPGNGYTWPVSNHGLQVDPEDNIWIGGNGDGDSHVLKFTRDGRFLMQVGEPGMDVDSNSMTHFSKVTKISFDADGNEAFIGDGYGNKRVVVVDAHTGEFLRYWGAYGNKPDDADLGAYDPDAPPAQQFRGPVHCAEPSNDGLVYVCDRTGNRVQVFQQDGTFVQEFFSSPGSLSAGSTWEIAFSPDAAQRFMYLADGLNRKVHVMDRETLEVLYSFGDGGRQPGQFYGVHSIETDSEGNIYTTETWEGKRVQKFIYRGMGMVEKGSDQAELWPTQN
jgi:DNA-binding beta-propeller fold protein YncE